MTTQSEDPTKLTHIGRYELRGTIGQGAMGIVYYGYDPAIDRPVAIKTIRMTNDEQRARFRQEIQAAGSFSHPNIVGIFDVGMLNELAFIVMELVEGGTVKDWLGTPVAWSKAATMVFTICNALDYAHRQGIIHRDIKPANILLTAEQTPKLGDFGVVRLKDAPRLTEVGKILGTVSYMAPEQLADEAIDQRADLFPLGVILFELVTGQHPFPTGQLRAMQAITPNFDLLQNQAPPALQAIVRQAMAEAPDSRFTSAAAMGTALAAVLDLPSSKGVRLHRSDLTGRLSIPKSVSIPHADSLLQVSLLGQVALTAAERLLITEAFSSYDRISINRELASAAGGTRLFSARPFRTGRPLAPILLKLTRPEIAAQEWQAYQAHDVARSLAIVGGNIPEAPLYGLNGQLALVRYTVAGDGDSTIDSLATFYHTLEVEQLSRTLQNFIFLPLAMNWWLNRAADRLPLHQEYDHVLPAHFVLEAISSTDAQGTVFEGNRITREDLRRIKVGEVLHLRYFQVQTMATGQREMMLQNRPTTNPIRFQITKLTGEQIGIQPGQRPQMITGRVVRTRHQLLVDAIQAALPNVDLSQKQIVWGQHRFPNLLIHYENLLENEISIMKARIHGKLGLDTILFEPNSGIAWLIDFAQTRSGHNLYDLLRVEVEIITKFMASASGSAKDDFATTIISLIESLHSLEPPITTPYTALQKPYYLLRMIRHFASQRLLNNKDWSDYYQGLILMLLGRLPDLAANPMAVQTAFIWATVSGDLMLKPPALSQTSLQPLKKSAKNRLGSFVFIVISLLFLAVVARILFADNFSSTFAPVPEKNKASTRAVVLIATPTASPTDTLTPTATPSPTDASPLTTTQMSISSAVPTLTPTATPSFTAMPTDTPTPLIIQGSAPAILGDALNIHRGPGINHPVIDTVVPGTIIQVTGQNISGDWWQIAYPAVSGGYAWIQGGYATFQVTATVVLRLVTALPPPTVTPTPTPTLSPTSTLPATAIPSPTPKPTAIPRVPSTPTPFSTPTAVGTPTVAANQARDSAYDAHGYRELLKHIGSSNSVAFSPDGQFLAITEGRKLHIVDRSGTQIEEPVVENEAVRPVEGIVWSPDGHYIAFIADLKQNCTLCRRVGIVHRSTKHILYIQGPDNQNTDAPRWTQDGHLLVTMHTGDVNHGIVYLFDTLGRGQIASGRYSLSSSTEGQKWHPWQPGRIWQSGQEVPGRYHLQ